jgi:OOP family OmpA-OmpF porin
MTGDSSSEATNSFSCDVLCISSRKYEKGISMNHQRRIGKISGLGLSFAMLTLFGTTAIAQQVVQGMIIGRDGPRMYVRTGDSQRQIVLLSDTTKATQKGGFLGMGHKDLGVAALVPGLQVKVDGSYDADHQLLAKDVEFSRGSMKTAQQIDAGLSPVNAKLAAQQDRLASDRRDIEETQQGIADSKAQIAANAQTEGEHNGATNSRIGELDQYETKDTLTINFANGRSTISQKDKDQLEEFVKTAAGTPGFMIQVQGYASKVGSPTLNQKLSSERADAVLTVIQQSGAVPLTRILAPAAMGTVEQVADNHSHAGQAQNRRVVVTVLVNKGISGGSTDQPASTSQPAAPPSPDAPSQ